MNIFFLGIDREQHGAVGVVPAGSRERDHLGVVIDEEPDVSEICLVESSGIDDLVEPSEIRPGAEHDRTARDKTSALAFGCADLEFIRPALKRRLFSFCSHVLLLLGSVPRFEVLVLDDIAVAVNKHQRDGGVERRARHFGTTVIEVRQARSKALSGNDVHNQYTRCLRYIEDYPEGTTIKLRDVTTEWLAKFRLRVTQSETFAVDPKTDAME